MLRRLAWAALGMFAVGACGAGPTPRPEPPECAGEGEAGAVGAALRAFSVWSDGRVLSHVDLLYNAVVSCRFDRDGAPVAVDPGANASRRHEPFALSCWARGGPADGQCQAFGHGRGLAPDIPPVPPAGAYDFERSWLLTVRAFEGDAVVVVTVGWMRRVYQAVVVRRGADWSVDVLYPFGQAD